MPPLAQALHWIVSILRAHAIPFQITGGLAAHVYGATRPINDIDIDIPEDRFPEIMKEVEPFITDGPLRYKEGPWDVYVMTLNYHEQEIDIGGSETTRILDRKTGIWHKGAANLSTAEDHELYGITVPIVHKTDLIEYKTWISLPGDHQERDVREIRVAPQKIRDSRERDPRLT